MCMDSFGVSDDLFSNILLRLPLKSVFQCRSVCKSWNSVISNPEFRQFYISGRSAFPPPLLGFFQFYFDHSYSSFGASERAARVCGNRPRISFLSATDPLCDPVDEIFYPSRSFRGIFFGGASNGLILLRHYGASYRVCNPFTNEFFILPRPNNCSSKVSVGFYSEDKEAGEGNGYGKECFLKQRFKAVVAEVDEQLSPEVKIEEYCSERGYWMKRTLDACVPISIRMHPGLSIRGGFFACLCNSNEMVAVYDSDDDSAAVKVICLPESEPSDCYPRLILSESGDGRLQYAMNMSSSDEDFFVYSLSRQLREYSPDRVVEKSEWCLRHVIRLSSPSHGLRRIRGIAFHPLNPRILYVRRDDEVLSCDIESRLMGSVSLHTGIEKAFLLFPYVQPQWPASTLPCI